MKFTEAQLERAFIELLGQEGVPHLPRPEILRAPEEVLIKEELRSFCTSAGEMLCLALVHRPMIPSAPWEVELRESAFPFPRTIKPGVLLPGQKAA